MSFQGLKLLISKFQTNPLLMPGKGICHYSLLLISSFLILLTGCDKNASSPNVLFIAVDDLYSSIGATRHIDGSFLKILYPDDSLRAQVAKRLTPNIDRLASESRMFVNATCESPLCGPSRTALLTGVPTHVSGYYKHKKHFRSFKSLENAITLPQYLKAKGYFTTGIGKVLHSPKIDALTPEGDWPDTRYSWSKWVSAKVGAGLGNASLPALSPKKKNMKFGPGKQKKEETSDWKNAAYIATLLKNQKASIFDIYTKKLETVNLPDDQPFFLAAGLFRPHLPFFAPKEYFELFPTDEMNIDSEFFDWVRSDLQDLPEGAREWIQLREGKFNQVISQGQKILGKKGKLVAWKQCIQAYLACVAFADDCVGEILNGLNNSPHKNNTIIVFWSDHGFYLGNKARLAKQCLWNEALKCNLIIKLPENQDSPGTPSFENVQLTDLYATITSLCGVDQPNHIMGEDISPLVKYPGKKLQRKYTYATYQEGNHTIFNKEFKYIRYQNGDKELYDVKNDHFEYTNLAEVKKYTKVINQFDSILNTELQLAEKYAVQ